MQFHASLVAFVDGKLQGVVTRCSAGVSGKASVPWLQAGWVDHGTSDTGLQEYGVDLGFLQTVEYLA